MAYLQIPYTIIGGRGFYQRQLVLDLYNYLAFLINQNNVSILSNNTNNIFNVKDNFFIKMNGSVHINSDLIIKNINYSKKIKSLLYDIYN